MNSVGEELGTIEELAIDLASGRIAYAVLFFSSFLGLDSKLFTI
jgi:sporulation protein YlmC with PRC-barrel domain